MSTIQKIGLGAFFIIIVKSASTCAICVMSESQAGIQAIIQEPSNQPIIKRFFKVAIATAVVPLLAYLLTYTISKRLDLKSHPLLSPPIISGLVAVLTLNLITGSFALYAVHEQPNLNPSATTTTSTTTAEGVASTLVQRGAEGTEESEIEPEVDANSHQKED